MHLRLLWNLMRAPTPALRQRSLRKRRKSAGCANSALPANNNRTFPPQPPTSCVSMQACGSLHCVIGVAVCLASCGDVRARIAWIPPSNDREVFVNVPREDFAYLHSLMSFEFYFSVKASSSAIRNSFDLRKKFVEFLLEENRVQASRVSGGNGETVSEESGNTQN